MAPGINDRHSVNEPLLTGIVSIDSMIPIGKGQREFDYWGSPNWKNCNCR